MGLIRAKQLHENHTATKNYNNLKNDLKKAYDPDKIMLYNFAGHITYQL